MVGKWDSDLSKEHLIQALKVVVTNATELITGLKNMSGTITQSLLYMTTATFFKFFYVNISRSFYVTRRT